MIEIKEVENELVEIEEIIELVNFQSKNELSRELNENLDRGN